MSDIRFTKSHEWVRIEEDAVTIGITDYAQQQLGDVVYVELPETGRALAQGREAAIVESVKAASEIYAPVSGSVIESNAALADDPALVNRDAAGEGWFFRLAPSNPAELETLLDAAGYTAFIESLD